MDRVGLKAMVATVREDHELLAEQLRILEAIENKLGEVERPDYEEVLRLLRKVCTFLDTKLLPHCKEEEQGLFVLFRQYMPPGSTLIYELEGEHDRIRKLCEQLRAELAILRYVEEGKQPLLMELRTLIAQIVAFMSHHAARETGLIEQCLRYACADECKPEVRESAPGSSEPSTHIQ